VRRDPDRAEVITGRLVARGVPDLPGISLYTAHPGSGLTQLTDTPPYWAYVWAGGAALAQHVLRWPDLVRGRTVLDLGAGSSVVGIAAALAGAAQVLAVEPDRWGQAAVAVNAALNGVAVRLVSLDPLPAVDLVLCGDVFYGAEVAAAMLPVLDRFRARGVRVLVGDPGRKDLPADRLTLCAEYGVRDMGDGPGVLRRTGVYDYALG
jgi:predicted nicotinamide N-methyase